MVDTHTQQNKPTTCVAGFFSRTCKPSLTIKRTTLKLLLDYRKLTQCNPYPSPIRMVTSLFGTELGYQVPIKNIEPNKTPSFKKV